jgi:exonuclease SbcC
VRPLRLEVHGLTSFREPTVVDFDGLELFAITGATGAGKSSLIDAMVFALYGQVPRVGREYRQLISHGAERLSVRLDFQVGRERYRIARAVRGSGATTQQRLERVKDEGVEPLADRVKDVETQVEAIVGLDYEAFIRSVVLPQGEFDAFLKGKPEERRKILVSLLNLRVYEDMHAAVNRRAADARREAEFIAGQLAGDYAGATPEALAARRQDLAEAEVRVATLDAEGKALEAAMAAAHALRSAAREVATVEKDLAGERARADEAGARLDTITKRQRALEECLAAARPRLAAAGFDEGRHLTLSTAQPRLEQLVEAEPKLQRREEERAARRGAVEAGLRGQKEAEDETARLEAEVEQRRAALEEARQHREDLRRLHAAHELRRHLQSGAACPVCAQVVTTLPAAAAPALDAADASVAEVEAAHEAARRDLAAARVLVERRRSDAHRATEEVARLEGDCHEQRAALGRLRDAVAAAGFTPIELADPKALLAWVRRELEGVARARAARDQAEAECRQLEVETARLAAEAASARAQVEAARARASELEARQAAALASVAAARSAWPDLPPRASLREALEAAEALDRRRADAQRCLTAAATEAARLRSEVERLERDVARATALVARRSELEADAALAASLARHLQANQFLAYVQEEAMRVLAEDGSRHLRTLSQGRYSLECEAQDFCVVDHWNADMRRSVRTLSGGETFVASLALALALAERLAELSVAGRAGESLESLFLDEGFGTLDPETLDLVVQALETLHGGQRMVGVVTHIQELAERLPARLQIARSAEGARVEVV